MIRFKLEGGDVVIRNFDKFDKDLRDDLDRVLMRNTLELHRNARQRCPVRFGRLRNSISWKVEEQAGTVGSDVHYAPHVNYGTGVYFEGEGGPHTTWLAPNPWTGRPAIHKGQRAQPFLTLSYEEQKPKFLADTIDTVKRAVA